MIVLSLFDAIVATWAISFLSLVDFEAFLSSSTTASTARSMPRFSPMGLAPAVTLRRPSLTASARFGLCFGVVLADTYLPYVAGALKPPVRVSPRL
jgi:hypothetical protein